MAVMRGCTDAGRGNCMAVMNGCTDAGRGELPGLTVPLQNVKKL